MPAAVTDEPVAAIETKPAVAEPEAVPVAETEPVTESEPVEAETMSEPEPAVKPVKPAAPLQQKAQEQTQGGMSMDEMMLYGGLGLVVVLLVAMVAMRKKRSADDAEQKPKEVADAEAFSEAGQVHVHPEVPVAGWA